MYKCLLNFYNVIVFIATHAKQNRKNIKKIYLSIIITYELNNVRRWRK